MDVVMSDPLLATADEVHQFTVYLWTKAILDAASGNPAISPTLALALPEVCVCVCARGHRLCVCELYSLPSDAIVGVCAQELKSACELATTALKFVDGLDSMFGVRRGWPGRPLRYTELQLGLIGSKPLYLSQRVQTQNGAYVALESDEAKDCADVYRTITDWSANRSARQRDTSWMPPTGTMWFAQTPVCSFATLRGMPVVVALACAFLDGLGWSVAKLGDKCYTMVLACANNDDVFVPPLYFHAALMMMYNARPDGKFSVKCMQMWARNTEDNRLTKEEQKYMIDMAANILRKTESSTDSGSSSDTSLGKRKVGKGSNSNKKVDGRGTTAGTAKKYTPRTSLINRSQLHRTGSKKPGWWPSCDGFIVALCSDRDTLRFLPELYECSLLRHTSSTDTLPIIQASDDASNHATFSALPVDRHNTQLLGHAVNHGLVCVDEAGASRRHGLLISGSRVYDEMQPYTRTITSSPMRPYLIRLKEDWTTTATARDQDIKVSNLLKPATSDVFGESKLSVEAGEHGDHVLFRPIQLHDDDEVCESTETPSASDDMNDEKQPWVWSSSCVDPVLDLEMEAPRTKRAKLASLLLPENQEPLLPQGLHTLQLAVPCYISDDNLITALMCFDNVTTGDNLQVEMPCYTTTEDNFLP
jgi:hypothetical protein